uniref:Nucleotide-diphospho-sugar transferase domain-containing protein n=1 Tax=Aegilops tauschii subsp. strangulata TaxID=200361 RepID=A0A453GBT3_AEGTS
DMQEERFPGLAELLPKVATDDGTVIVTSVNEAWAAPGSLLDLFRESFNNGEGIAHLLNHTLIVAVDPGAMSHCEAVHPHCYLLEVTSANVSSANGFFTESYLELVWAKLSLQQRVLQLGYNYLFTLMLCPCRMWMLCGCVTRSGISASTPTWSSPPIASVVMRRRSRTHPTPASTTSSPRTGRWKC